MEVVKAPIDAANKALKGNVQIQQAFIGVGAPLMFQIKLCFLAAAIGTCPYWLYQLWAFIVPVFMRTNAGTPGRSLRSPGRSSWPEWRPATTCCRPG